MISILMEEFKQYFNYNQLAKTQWQDLIQQAKKDFNIWFDLENNDPIKGATREIAIDDPGKHISGPSRFRCQLCCAGGDWEYPVYYFKCQLYEGYARGLSKYGKSMLIFIPGKIEGNTHLLPIEKGSNKGGWRAPHDGEDPDPKKIGTEKQPNKAWVALKVFLQNNVNENHKDRQKEW